MTGGSDKSPVIVNYCWQALIFFLVLLGALGALGGSELP
jgi:hypothetical protein